GASFRSGGRGTTGRGGGDDDGGMHRAAPSHASDAGSGQ
ncbi:MAG: hypothetical protein AVDCRST_MAG64-692, partial [uncultured Phycisphaerae bacterium]